MCESQQENGKEQPEEPAALSRLPLSRASVGALLNAAGNAAVAESRHFPYGGVRWSLPEQGPFPTDYRWTGQRVDLAVQLYFMGARQMDPSLGRWISPDTIIPDPQNPQSLNRYSHVNNRPLGFTDPTGHYMKDVHQDLTQQIATKVATRVTLMRGLVVLPAEQGRLRAAPIAYANQYTDENPKTTSTNFWNEGPAADGRSIAEYYHFVSRSEAEGRLQQAIKNKDISDFGTALHAYQDYWSHTRKGFSVPMGEDGLKRIHKVCPECSSLYADDILEERAKMKGHFPLRWNDYYTPDKDMDDVFMSQLVEYWLVLFYCALYEIDPEEYWSLYGPEQEQVSGETEPQ